MTIKNIFKSYEDWVLVAAAALLAGGIIAFFVWGITFLATHIGTAVTPPDPKKEEVRFDIEGAKALDARGLGKIE